MTPANWTPITRRTVIAGAAPLAAAMATAMPVSAAGACTYPDLEREFNAIYERWRAKYLKDRAGLAAGVDTPDDDADENGQDIVWNDILDIMYPLCNRITVVPAHTGADLVLMARSAALLNSEYWTDTNRTDYPGGVATMMLMQSICDLAGVELFPGVDVPTMVVPPLCGTPRRQPGGQS